MLDCLDRSSTVCPKPDVDKDVAYNLHHSLSICSLPCPIIKPPTYIFIASNGKQYCPLVGPAVESRLSDTFANVSLDICLTCCRQLNPSCVKINHVPSPDISNPNWIAYVPIYLSFCPINWEERLKGHGALLLLGQPNPLLTLRYLRG